jgi:hypothetical protein
MLASFKKALVSRISSAPSETEAESPTQEEVIEVCPDITIANVAHVYLLARLGCCWFLISHCTMVCWLASGKDSLDKDCKDVPLLGRYGFK